MNDKIYKVTKYSGMLSTRKTEYIGTLAQLSESLKDYLHGTKCRKPEALERKLNASMRQYNGTYWESFFTVKEIES